jgi:hypothetical protein
MKKTILAIIGLTISLNSMAQMPTKIWVTNPKSNDTIGYIDQKYQQFIVTRQITQLEFDKLQNMYLGAYTIVTREGQIIDQYKPQPVVSSSTTSPIDINSRGFYLVKAGEYKNASIAVSLGTSVIVGAVLANPSKTMNGYSTQTMTAGVIGAIGGLISFGLNIAGNNMLIKAGSVK